MAVRATKVSSKWNNPQAKAAQSSKESSKKSKKSLSATAAAGGASSSTTTTSTTTTTTSLTPYKLNAFGQECPKPAPRWTAAETDQLEKLVQQVCAREQLASQSELFGKRKRKRGGGGETNGDVDDDDHGNGNKNNNDNNNLGSGTGESVWFEMARAFPHRQVEAVYKKAWRTFQNQACTRGPWSAEETSRLMELVALHGKKWAYIGTLLNRTSDSVADKYRESHLDFKKGEWTTDEEDKLMALVAKYTNGGTNGGSGANDHLHSDPSAIASNDNDDEDTGGLPWTVISKQMETRSRLQCLLKWRHIVSDEKTTRSNDDDDNDDDGKKNKKAHKRKQTTSNDNTQPKKKKRKTKTTTEQQEQRPAKSTSSASLSRSSAPPPLPQLYACLDKLCREHWEKNQLHVVTTRDILQALHNEFLGDKNQKFDKETRMRLKQRLKDQVRLLASSSDKHNHNHNRSNNNNNNNNSNNVATSKGVDDNVNEKRKHPQPTLAGTTSNTAVPSSPTSAHLTLEDVAKAMKKALKKVPDRRLKEKTLRRTLKAKFSKRDDDNNNKKAKSKHLKKYMKQILREASSSSNDNRSPHKTPKFKLDGKMVSLV